jgi:ribosome-associated protein
MPEIQINREPVELYKILKFEGLATSGAEAKQMISSGLVLLNGVVELQKSKKIMAHDVLTIDSENYQIVLEVVA